MSPYDIWKEKADLVTTSEKEVKRLEQHNVALIASLMVSITANIVLAVELCKYL